MPLGFRQGHAAVRNAELRLTQARAVLRDEERTVINELSTAVAEKDRAFIAVQTAYDRSAAAERQLGALKEKYKVKKEGFFEVLDAQRQLADALERYYQSRVEYAIAIRNVHFEKGSLLDYCDICLSEGGWPAKAYKDAARRESHREAERSINYVFHAPPVVAQNPPCQAVVSVPMPPFGPAQPAVPLPPVNEPETIPAPNPIPIPNPPAGPAAAQGATQQMTPAPDRGVPTLPPSSTQGLPGKPPAANVLGLPTNP